MKHILLHISSWLIRVRLVHTWAEGSRRWWEADAETWSRRLLRTIEPVYCQLNKLPKDVTNTCLSQHTSLGLCAALVVRSQQNARCTYTFVKELHNKHTNVISLLYLTRALHQSADARLL